MKAIILADSVWTPQQLKKLIKSQNKKDKKIWIACDGSAQNFKKIKIFPDLIIGDFDSLSPKDLFYFKNKGKTNVLYKEDLDTTDLEKALLFCIEKKINKIEIYGAFGKRADHSYYHFSLLKKYYKKNLQISLWTEYEKIYYSSKNKIKFENKCKKRLSFFGCPEAKISTYGLQYELKNTELSFGDFDSISNVILTSHAWIQVHRGGLLVMESL